MKETVLCKSSASFKLVTQIHSHISWVKVFHCLENDAVFHLTALSSNQSLKLGNFQVCFYHGVSWRYQEVAYSYWIYFPLQIDYTADWEWLIWYTKSMWPKEPRVLNSSLVWGLFWATFTQMGKCIEYSYSKPSITKKNGHQLGFPGMGCIVAGDSGTSSLTAIWLCWGGHSWGLLGLSDDILFPL